MLKYLYKITLVCIIFATLSIITNAGSNIIDDQVAGTKHIYIAACCAGGNGGGGKSG